MFQSGVSNHIFTSCTHILTSCSHILTSCSHILTSCSHILTSCSHIFTSCNHILTSCQTHRVTSRQSNSVISKRTFQTLYQVNPYTKPMLIQTQNMHTQTSNTNIQTVPSVLPLLNEHIRLGHAGIVDHSL